MEFNKSSDVKSESEKMSEEAVNSALTLDFSAFILSLSSSALVGLGELPDPISKEKKPNVKLAKQMIDVINMLKEKTKGNLSREESELIMSLCSELKMKYLQLINYK